MNEDLLGRLKSYIAKMEPHQKEHPRGRLLIEAYEALRDAVQEVSKPPQTTANHRQPSPTSPG